MIELQLPKWYDLHVHLRQGDAMPAYVQAHVDMGCAGALAMPNTKPPAAVVFEEDEGDEYWSLERYRRDLMAAGADQFDVLITPLYMTKDTTPDMIIKGAESGILQTCKSYPPHGTTGAEFGVPIDEFVDRRTRLLLTLGVRLRNKRSFDRLICPVLRLGQRIGPRCSLVNPSF